MRQYRKHYIALESDPEIFTSLIRSLGVLTPPLVFRDVSSLDDVDNLPRPALALILVFPTCDSYEAQRLESRSCSTSDSGNKNAADEDGIMWFEQTINNACGLYAILHAICNGVAKEFICPDSLLATLLSTYVSLPRKDRAAVLEDCTELEEAYKAAAIQGESPIPVNNEDEVDFHYVCFAQSTETSRLYELDGDKEGPIDTGVCILPGDDLFCDKIRDYMKCFIERKGDTGSMFSMIVLTTTG